MVDESIDPTRDRPGRVVKAHLRDPLIVGGSTLAAAGTIVQLRVEGLTKERTATGSAIVEDVATDGLLIRGGRLPLHSLAPIGPSASGSLLEMATLAVVDATDPEHVDIQIRLPVHLSTDSPHGEFTPIPLKTPTPVIRPTARAKATPSPTASPTPTSAPSDAPATAPSSSPAPTASP